MKTLKCIIILCLSGSSSLSYSQDSLAKTKLKFFDLCVHAIGEIGDQDFSYNDVTLFTKNQSFLDARKNYSEKKDSYIQNHDLFDLGISSSIQFKDAKSKFLKRLKPRFSALYGKRTFTFDKLAYSNSVHIDTLYFTNPSVPPLYIDSVTEGSMIYQYVTNQLILEAGANFDVYTKRYFNFYAGLVFARGISFKNDFSVHKYEFSTVDRYPGQEYPDRQTLQLYTMHESGPRSYLTRISACFGVQHRFSQRKNISPGFFAELRPGIEKYNTQGGKSLSRFIVSISGGFRLSLRRHK